MRIVWFIVLFSAWQFAFGAKKVEVAKEDLSDVKAQIEALKKALDNDQAAHKDATDALKESESAISQANKKLHDIAREQRKNQSKLASLKKESLTLNDRLAQQQKELGQLLYRQYTRGNQSYAQLILQNKNPHEIARDLAYYRYVTQARANLIHEMQANLGEVAVLNEETKTALNEVSELKAQQESERQALQAQQAEKVKVVKTLSKQIASTKEQIDKLKRDEKNLSNLVERLAKIVPPKPKLRPSKKLKNKTLQQAPGPEDMQETAPETGQENKQETKQETAVVASNEQLPGNDLNGEFNKLRGKLRLPVRGDVTNRFGSARADTGVTWKGLFIRASGGSEVKAVADGRVVFADWMRGFGNLIIIDHGDGYMSLYGNNQAVLKGVGETINSGDTIASVGNTGGNESDGLYYELRKNSKPFDPLSWSSLR